MQLQSLVVAGLAIGRVVADVYGPTSANNATHPTAKDGNITIHYVTVGKLQNEFVPNSLDARVGDIVSFQFYPANHSVIRSEYGYPCIPIEDLGLSNPDPFFSGFKPVDAVLSNPPTFNITVNQTGPIFYYCGAPGSCTDWGMVGVINANATQSIATQIRLARQADYMLLPGQGFPSEQAQESMASLAQTATRVETTVVTATPTNSPSSTPSPSKSSSGISGGTVAGIAVGAAVVALIIAGLFYFMRRTRRLKQKLDISEASVGRAQRPDHPDMTSPAKYQSFAGYSEHDWNNTNSSSNNSQAAPAYRPWQDLNAWERSPNKPVDSFSQSSPRVPTSPAAELSPNAHFSPQQRVYSFPQELDSSHPDPNPNGQYRFSS